MARLTYLKMLMMLEFQDIRWTLILRLNQKLGTLCLQFKSVYWSLQWDSFIALLALSWTIQLKVDVLGNSKLTRLERKNELENERKNSFFPESWKKFGRGVSARNVLDRLKTTPQRNNLFASSLKKIRALARSRRGQRRMAPRNPVEAPARRRWQNRGLIPALLRLYLGLHRSLVLVHYPRFPGLRRECSMAQKLPRGEEEKIVRKDYGETHKLWLETLHEESWWWLCDVKHPNLIIPGSIKSLMHRWGLLKLILLSMLFIYKLLRDYILGQKWLAVSAFFRINWCLPPHWVISPAYQFLHRHNTPRQLDSLTVRQLDS